MQFCSLEDTISAFLTNENCLLCVKSFFIFAENIVKDSLKRKDKGLTSMV